MGGSLRRLKKNRPKVRTGITAKKRHGKKVKTVVLKDNIGCNDDQQKRDGDGYEGDNRILLSLGESWEQKKTTVQNYAVEGVANDANAALKNDNTNENGNTFDEKLKTMTQDEINVTIGKARSAGKAPPRRLTVRLMHHPFCLHC